jgi:hypothetical protein
MHLCDYGQKLKHLYDFYHDNLSLQLTKKACDNNINDTQCYKILPLTGNARLSTVE